MKIKKLAVVVAASSVGLIGGSFAYADNDGGNGVDRSFGLDESTCEAMVSGQAGIYQSYYDMAGYKKICENYLKHKKASKK